MAAKHSFFLGAALAALAGGLGTAHAGDPPVVYDSSAVDWTGFYAGVQGGWALDVAPESSMGLGPITIDFDNSTLNGSGSYDIGRINGPFGGVHVGGNYQHGPVVFGGEASVSMGLLGKARTTDLDLTYVDNDPQTTDATIHFDSTEDFGLNWLSTFTGKVGVGFGNYLVYGKGGLAVADASYVGSGTIGYNDPDATLDLDVNVVNGPFSTSTSQLLMGPTVGIGIESMLTDQISLGVEYNYVMLPTLSTLVGSLLGDGFTSASMHTVQGTLNFHF